MTVSTISESQCKTARVAAVLYLLMVLTAPFALIYVPRKLIVPGDATATAERLRASESLVRLGIGSELFHQAVAIFLVLALYRLFKPVNEKLAVLVVILGALVSVPIVFLNVVSEIAALILVSGADFLSVFEKQELDALAYLFLRLHEQGLVVTSVFWGLWLFPFGMLVIQSGFIPRLLGVLLIIAGSAYLASSFASLVLPRYAELVDRFAMVLAFGELPFTLWLWIWGVRLRPSVVPTAESASG
jgi:hypothetical protein